MKKFYLLALAMCAAQLSAQDFSDENGYEYTILSENTAEFTSVGDDNKYSIDELIIPETVENEGTTYTIVAIGDGAAQMCGLSTLEVPASVTRIGDEAFSYCWSLSEVVLSEATEWIGDEAFANCSMLSDFTLPTSLKHIGYQAFYSDYSIECPLTFAEGVEIGEEAFYGVSSEEVTFLGEPASVGDGALVMDYLTTVTLYIATPPTSFSPADVFDESALADIQLIVPAGCSDQYWESEEWSVFGDISEMDNQPTALNSLQAAHSSAIYTLDGKRQNAMTQGMNIVATESGKTIVFIK